MNASVGFFCRLARPTHEPMPVCHWLMREPGPLRRPKYWLTVILLCCVLAATPSLCLSLGFAQEGAQDAPTKDSFAQAQQPPRFTSTPRDAAPQDTAALPVQPAQPDDTVPKIAAVPPSDVVPPGEPVPQVEPAPAIEPAPAVKPVPAVEPVPTDQNIAQNAVPRSPTPQDTLALTSSPQAPAKAAKPEAAAPRAQSPASSMGTDQAGKRIQIFGTVEFKGNFKTLTQWINAMDAHKKNPIFVPGSKLNTSTTWDALKSSLLKKSPREQLKAVNNFWNQWPYRQDPDVYGKPDFWAAPYLFRKNSGDCEDYCIAKYFTLRELGYPPEQMRIVVVMEKIRNIAHAVLVVFMDGDAFVLDNLTNNVLSHTRHKNYAPQYSVNEQFRWAHIRPK